MIEKLKREKLRTICHCIITCLIALSAANAFAADKKPIKIGWMAWTENEAVMGTAKAVLEDKIFIGLFLFPGLIRIKTRKHFLWLSALVAEQFLWGR